jgi:hypothetical protein
MSIKNLGKGFSEIVYKDALELNLKKTIFLLRKEYKFFMQIL